MMSAGNLPVHFYVGKDGNTEQIFTAAQRADFAKEGGLGCNLDVLACDPVAVKNNGAIVLSNNEKDLTNPVCDGVILENNTVLVLSPESKIKSDDIL